MPKIAPPPTVAPETWRALLAAAADFAAVKPWEFAVDSDPVGLTEPTTGGTRLGHVLGNAGEVFAAVVYRRAGLRWLLTMLSEAPEPGDLNHVDGMDCLKLEFVPKRELWKEDMAFLKEAGFKPSGRGHVWPQFRSSNPGWHPWHLDQAEADQFLTDLPRLTAFYRLFEKNPDLFAERDALDIPFLPTPLPARPLTVADLDWRPMIPPPPANLEAYEVSAGQLEELRSLRREPGSACGFDCTLMPGASFFENGRPCYGRVSLLVENRDGMILGMDVASGALSPGEAAGRSLVKALLMAERLPELILIRGTRWQPVLNPLCDKLGIRLESATELPLLEEVLEDLETQMLSAPFNR